MASMKSKEFDGRKRKFDENMQYKNLNSDSASFFNKQNMRVLKPSSVSNLVEMVKKHTVYVPQTELYYGEQLEGMNFMTFLKDNLIIHETPIPHKEPSSPALEKFVKTGISKQKPKEKVSLRKSGSEEVNIVQKRKAEIEADVDDRKSIVLSHLDKCIDNNLGKVNELEPVPKLSSISSREKCILFPEVIQERRDPAEFVNMTLEESLAVEKENSQIGGNVSPLKSSPISVVPVITDASPGYQSSVESPEPTKLVLEKFIKVRLEKLDLTKTKYYRPNPAESLSFEFQTNAEIIDDDDEYENNEGFEEDYDDYEVIDESYGEDSYEDDYHNAQEMKITEKSDVLSEAIKEINEHLEESHYETAEEFSSSKIDDQLTDIVPEKGIDGTNVENAIIVCESVDITSNIEFPVTVEEFGEKNQYYQSNGDYFENEEIYEEGEEYFPEGGNQSSIIINGVPVETVLVKEELPIAPAEQLSDKIPDKNIQGLSELMDNETRDVFVEEITTPEGEHLSDEYNDQIQDDQENDVQQEIITLDSDSDYPNKISETIALKEIKIDENVKFESEVQIVNACETLESTIVTVAQPSATLSIDTEPPNSLLKSLSALGQDYVKTLTPTLTFHDEEQEEDGSLQPLIRTEELLENSVLVTKDKPNSMDKHTKIVDEDLDSKPENIKELEGKSVCDLDSDLEEPISFLVDETESALSPRQITYQQVFKALEASKAFHEKSKDFDKNELIFTQHNKVEQDFQEFVDEAGGQVFVNRISEPVQGLKIFDPSLTFAYFNYTHLPYLKQKVFINPQNHTEKFLEKLPCCDLISSLIIENGIQGVFHEFEKETLKNFLAFAWKVSSCHPDYQVVSKCVEFFKWANQELSQTWYPTVSNIIEVLINLGATKNDNKCPFKNTVESTLTHLSYETQSYKELNESLPTYRLQLKSTHDCSDLAVKNLGAILDILSFTIDKSLELVDTLVLLVWLSMDPLVRTSNLRNKIQKCVAYAIEKSPELFFANYVTDLSRRLVELCDSHDDALCLIRGLPSGGRGRELQKMVSFGILQHLLRAPKIIYNTENTIDHLVQLFSQYRISPKMDCHFLHTVISLVEIFVGNDIVPSQKRALCNLSAMLNKSISQISDNYLNPENGMLKTQMTLFKSKWNLVCHSVCDEEKKVFRPFSHFGPF